MKQLHTLTPLALIFGLLMTTTTFSQSLNSDKTTITDKQPSSASHTEASADSAVVVKSANDTRDYAYEVLPNGFKLLVISDKKAQRAAAAVDVGVGSASDPDAFLGLAHFLEHMLFLGTDKYPDPDDYINYISDHGGNHNAFTAFDHTNYFFDIDPKHLHEGLKRFSRFFVAPTFAEAYVQRERNAVDSEYQAKLREDGWRNMESLKQAVNRKHPYSRFSIGRLDTLPAETVRPALLDFYQRYYSADRMSAIITGREDSATLLQWGRELFADVPKRAAVDLSIKEKLFADADLPKVIKNTSIKQEKNLSLYFQLPYDKDNEYSKSLSYLSYILGYEGEGSLLEALKQLGYASELYAGAGYRIGEESSFEIGVQLTDKGYSEVNKVTAVIFAYLDLLRKDDNGASRYSEIATVAETAFAFKEKHNAMHEVSSLATRLNRFPVKDVQALNAIFTGYNKAQIDGYLARMIPALAVVHITAPDIKGSENSPYFNVPYDISAVEATSLTQLTGVDSAVLAGMRLPHNNPFIADDYALKAVDITEKHSVLDSGVALYYKNDKRFKVPRASVQTSLQPTVDLTIGDKTAMALLALLLDEQLTTTLYDADIAGLHTDIGAGEKSIGISLEGYQQKMPDLLTVILQQLKTLQVDTQTFVRVKADYRQDLQNSAAKMPYQQTFIHLNAALVTDASLPEQRLAALDGIDEQALQVFADKLLKSLAVRMLVYGNETYEGAQALAQTLSAVLDKTSLNNTWQPNAAKVIKDNITTRFEVAHDDNAITYYLQGGKGYAARAQIGLLGKMLEPEFFTQLRTQQQLGYVVFAYPRPTYEQAGMGFTVQSPVATAAALEKHIVDFNQRFSKTLTAVSDSDFQAVKTILKAELLQAPENLMSAASQYWSDILTTNSTASSRKAIAYAIDGVDLSDFVSRMQALLTDAKHVSIQAVAAKVH